MPLNAQLFFQLLQLQQSPNHKPGSQVQIFISCFGSSSSYERIPNASNEYSQIIKPLGWRSLQHTRVAQHFFQTARNATPTGATHPTKKLPKPCSFTTGVSNRSAGPCILKFDNEQYARNVCYSCKSGQTSLHPVGLVAVVHAPKNGKTN